jgi:hypothetical protein
MDVGVERIVTAKKEPDFRKLDGIVAVQFCTSNQNPPSLLSFANLRYLT